MKIQRREIIGLFIVAELLELKKKWYIAVTWCKEEKERIGAG